MAARTERLREMTSLMAIAFNAPEKLDEALPKAPAQSARRWW